MGNNAKRVPKGRHEAYTFQFVCVKMALGNCCFYPGKAKHSENGVSQHLRQIETQTANKTGSKKACNKHEPQIKMGSEIGSNFAKDEEKGDPENETKQ